MHDDAASEQEPSPGRTRRFRKFFAWGLIAAGMAGLLGAGWLYVRQPPVPKVPAAALADAPSTDRPDQQTINNYSVAPDLPKYIEIPAAGVPKTRVLHLGLLKNHAIATPDNIFDTGWYEKSAKPGQTGAMFVYGHVSSWLADGIFHDLQKLKRGDIVDITRGDGKKFTYEVTSTKTYPHDKVDMQRVLSPDDPHRPGLNLMTCAGHVIAGTSEFSERLVVFTRLADH